MSCYLHMTDSKHNIIDLAGWDKQAAKSTKIFMCPQCGFSLVADAASKRNNPYMESPYWCNSCDKIWDSSVTKLKTSSRPVQGSVSKADRPMVQFVPSGADSGRPKAKTYEDVNPEPFEDENFKAQGMEIVSSTVELTDSHGNHQIFTKEPPKKPDRFRPITQLD